MAEFILNGKTVTVDLSADTPLLWVLRDHLKLNGTKYGCGKALCGSCTVLFNGRAVRSCIIPISMVDGQIITTIEGLEEDHPVLNAWIEENVSQCGYCQPGQVMSAVSLLNENPEPTDQEIRNHMSGNICRCGTYPRIFKAVKTAAKMYRNAADTSGTGNP